MYAVIEIDEVWKVVDPGPLKRLARTKAGADGFENGRVRPDLGMAGHAGLSGRKTGEGRRLDRRVAVPAIDTVIADMMLVTERNRLIEGYIDIGDKRSRVNLVRRQHNNTQNHQRRYDTHLRDTVRAAMEQLCHV